MRTAQLVTIGPEDDVGISDGETIFNGLLLAVIGRRRLLVLVGDAPATRVGLLARLARHVESEGCMVMTVAANPGVTVEDLIEVAGSSMLGPDCTPRNFEELVDALEERLDLAGTGILMVEEADRLSGDTLRDLVELSGSVTPSGRFLQVLLSGGPDLPRRLESTGLLPTIDTVGTLYTIGPTVGHDHGELRVSADGSAGFGRPDPARQRKGGKRRWMAAAFVAVVAAVGLVWLNDRGMLDGDRIADLLNRTAEPEIAQTDEVGDAGPANAPVQPPEAMDTDPAEPDPGTFTPEPGTFTAEDVARFADLAGEVLRGDPRVTEAEEAPLPAPATTSPTVTEAAPQIEPAPTAVIADELPPAAESQPLEPDELAELETSRTASLSGDTAGPDSGPDDMATDAVADEPPATEETALSTPVAPDPVDRERVRALIAAAEAQFAQRKLTTPRDDNAFATLQALRAIDPDSRLADEMRRRILETYQQWARTAENRNDWRTARIYYQRALRVAPADPGITAKLDIADDRLANRSLARPAPADPVRPARTDAPPEPRLRP